MLFKQTELLLVIMEGECFHHQDVHFEQRVSDSGIIFKAVKTEEDLTALTDIYFDDFLKGEPFRAAKDKRLNCVRR